MIFLTDTLSSPWIVRRSLAVRRSPAVSKARWSVDHPHLSAAELLEDPVVRKSLTDHRELRQVTLPDPCQ
jgi:hypothetical protein